MLPVFRSTLVFSSNLRPFVSDTRTNALKWLIGRGSNGQDTYDHLGLPFGRTYA